MSRSFNPPRSGMPRRLRDGATRLMAFFHLSQPTSSSPNGSESVQPPVSPTDRIA